MSDSKILIVDDNEMNRDMLSRRLQRQKYNVAVAEDGEQALAMVKQDDYDLILLDIMMPTISGYEVLEQLKADMETSHIPVIMISAVDDLDSVVKCIELGAEDYLFKPFNPVLLKARVGASLSKNRGNVNMAKIVASIAEIHADMKSLVDTADNGQREQLQQLTQKLAEIESELKN